ncbi:hypothetical protein DKP78_26915, partial [Enterococcus faecium]
KFLDLLGPGLVEEVVKLLPPVTLLAEVDGELPEIWFGEAEERAFGRARRGGGGGDASSERARERGGTHMHLLRRGH